MNTPKNAWFINFTGIGNGIIIAPILRCFEASFPSVKYFHSENKVLSDDWFVSRAQLNNLVGFSPIAWRRFTKEDWPKIADFMREHQIDLVINLRNEGPRYADISYYQFKDWVKNILGQVSFWDLDFEEIEKRQEQQNLTKDIIELFRGKGVSFDRYNPLWLKTTETQKTGIGFGMAASQKNKRWSVQKWISLGFLIRNTLGEQMVLFPGMSDEEVQQAEEVRMALGNDLCRMVTRESLPAVANQISSLRCFVSNDTGLLHIAAAEDIPSVGLYTSTDPSVWAPNKNSSFKTIENSFFKAKCPDRKVYCGNCFHYYDPCPAIAEYGDDIDPTEVIKAIKELL